MGATKIEWTDETWNPIRGTIGKWHCTHVSEGCRNCYAERLNVRWGGPAYKPGADTFRLDEKILQQPLHWKKPRKIFVCDMTDLFHEKIPNKFIFDIWLTMQDCPQHTFQVLTKRPARMIDFLSRGFMGFGTKNTYIPHPHIWLGVSVEDQATANERIPLLLQAPATVRFVSYEPALGPVDFSGYLHDAVIPGSIPNERDQECSFVRPPGLDWLIIGGESGPKARPFSLEWASVAIAQCQAAGAPVFMKQIGSNACWEYKHGPIKQTAIGFEGVSFISPLGKLKHPKGGDMSEWPEKLRVREFPKGA